MSTLGKVLIFFNLLAGGAFAYFAMQSYYGEPGQNNGRQNINAAGVRQFMTIQGLPLGTGPGDPTDLPSDPEFPIPFRVMMAGSFETESISKKLLESYFKQAPGTPEAPDKNIDLSGPAVPNQIAEVKRVKAKIDSILADNAEKPDDKLRLLTGLLLLQPEVYEERQAIQKLIADKKVDEMQALLDAKFKAVLDAPQSVATEVLTKLPETEEDAAKRFDKIKQVDDSRAAPLDELERRNRIAHLLVHLSPDPNWQKRVVLVVGLRQFAKAILNQAERFAIMAERIKLILPIDQQNYLAAERNQLLLAINRTTLANHQAELKLKWTEQEKKDADFVWQRETQLKTIQARYAKTKLEVDEMLVKQANIEAALFEVQREVAITLDEVYRLEGVLEARERDLLNLPPKVGGKN
ncbi:MAG: hypothetical protein U0792_04730 [Gemmataceae bacterium]